MLLKYFETLKETLRQYVLLTQSGAYNLTQIQLELFNSQDFYDLYVMQFHIIQNSYRYLVNVLRQEENSDYITKIDTRIAGFIVFLIVICLFYLIIWIPYVNNLNA